jgi:phage terminase large subunit-like protein
MQHHQDLTNSIIREERERRKLGYPPVWTIRIYPAIQEDPTSGSPAKVLWPDKWTFDRLTERKREIGTVSFEKMYQNVAVNEDLLCFRANFLQRCKDSTFSVGEIPENARVFIGVDPAISMSNTSSFFVMVALAAIKGDPRVWIVDVFRDRVLVKQQVEWIRQWYLKYRPVQTRIETNAYQSALKQVIRDKYPDIPITPHFTGKNKVDPETGIVSTCAPLVENALLRIPWGSRESIRKMDQVLDELQTWPQGEHDDVPMALWIAASAVRDSINTGKSRSGEWGTTVRNPAYAEEKPKMPEPEEFKPSIDLFRGGRIMHQPEADYIYHIVDPERGAQIEKVV